MNLPFKIAFRYLKGKNTTQAINIVSWISMGAVALSTTAMVVLFSVYNGLESYVKGMYTSFYPEVKIAPLKGKFFSVEKSKILQLKSIQGVQHIGFSIEDMVLLEGHDRQKVVKLKGVDNDWFLVNDMAKHINTGTAYWPEHNLDIPSNIGVDIIAEMGIDVNNPYRKIQLYYPKATASVSGMDMAAALNSLEVAPYASFHIQAELDGTYFLVPISAAQTFFETENKLSAIEIAIANPKAATKIIAEVKQIMGPDFEVLSRLEQNKTLFMATQMEKWMIYGILALVMIIASFNMVGALSMLAIEKKLDVSILKTMGANNKMIRKVFMNLSILITFVGAIIGLILGLIIVLTQLQWSWLKMGDGFLDAYPVELQWFDFVVVSATVLFVGIAAGWYPARKASNLQMIFRDE